jgi:hypothetical protein
MIGDMDPEEKILDFMAPQSREGSHASIVCSKSRTRKPRRPNLSQWTLSKCLGRGQMRGSSGFREA